MSTANTASGGGDQNSGGDSGNNQNQNQNSSNDAGNKSPSYESYQKLLDEKKKVQAENEEFKRKEKEREDTRLKEQGDFKKLLEQREADLQAEKAKSTKLETSINDSRKLSAFLDKVSGDVPKQYWSLIDLDKIPVDPNTGAPDESSIAKAVKDFEKEYPDVIKKGSTGGGLPADAAQGGGAKLTYDAWKKLPLKEQLDRMKDVDKATL